MCSEIFILYIMSMYYLIWIWGINSCLRRYDRTASILGVQSTMCIYIVGDIQIDCISSFCCFIFCPWPDRNPLVKRKPKIPCPSPSPTLISNGIPLFNSETSRIYRWCLGIVISMLGWYSKLRLGLLSVLQHFTAIAEMRQEIALAQLSQIIDLPILEGLVCAGNQSKEDSGYDNTVFFNADQHQSIG